MDIKVDAHTTIVFDLDDTLYKEIDFLRSAYKEIAQSIDQKNWHILFGYMFALYQEGQNVFEILSQKYGGDVRQLIEQYRNHKPVIYLANGATDLIKSIKHKEGKLAILTDGRSLTQLNKIRALGLDNTIDQFFISEDLGTEKPHENNFRAIENHFATRNYWYIADNFKKDFVTAKARNWNTIGLIDNGLNIHHYSPYYLLANHKPNYLVMDLTEIKIK